MLSAYDALVQVMRERFAAIDTQAPARARNPEISPAAQLSHLAWSRGLDYWSEDWTADQQRAFIKQAPANLRRRGTRAAIDSAVAAYDTELTLEEWWEQTPEGDPCTGIVTVEPGSFVETDPDALDTIRRLLNRESRKAMHWTIAVGITGEVAIAAEARVRVTSLCQFSGVMTGA